MKKILLFAAMAAVSASAFAQTDITPEAYKFSQRTVGEKLEVQATCSDWNAPAMSSEKIQELAPNGGLVYLNNSAETSYLSDATCIVDLGGNVGHVLAIAGADFAGVNAAFKENGLGEIKNAPESTVWGTQFNAYTDPATTPASSIIKADIVVNAYCESTAADQAVWSNFYYMTAANDVTPANANGWDGNSVYAPDFCQVDEDGDLITDDDENPIYDPCRWLRFTTYIQSLAADTESWPYSNAVKAKLWTGGSFTGVVLFIKELSFTTTELTAESEEFAGQTNMTRTVETWSPDPNKVQDAIKTVQAAAKFNVVNGTFVSTENAQVYTIDGKQVLQGTSGQLAKGAYVAKINGASVKFTVK